MSRYLLVVSGIVLLAVLSMPLASYGQHTGPGVRMAAAPGGHPKNPPVAQGVLVAPRAPEVFPQTPARTSGTIGRGPVGGTPELRNKVAPTRDAAGTDAPRTALSGPTQTAVSGDYSGDLLLPDTLGQVLATSFPDPAVGSLAARRPDRRRPADRQNNAPVRPQMETHLTPGESPPVAEAIQPISGTKYRYLEIEVSHSAHLFKLLGVTQSGTKDVLYDCMVGLGSKAEFPTPVGVYYVTHIYDDNPWWIPPANRPWAWGQSPSQRVYGGTMAPLLKKRSVTSRNKGPTSDDYIADEVKLEDYGYRFHGTNAPRSIGRNESHGCVRMLPKDAGEVAKLIKEYVGTAQRQESENGTFAVLRAPVRLNLIK